MNTDSLREFTELAKHLSFTETARSLNVSQPTLSKHIAQFEKELRLTLFKRSGNSLRLTNVGAALLPYAYQVTDAQNDFIAKVSELRRNAPSRLTVSGLTDEGPSTEVMGFLLGQLSPKYGVNFLEIKSRYNRDLRDMLSSEEVDLIFDPVPDAEALNEQSIGKIHVANLRLVAIVDVNHRFAQCSSISIEELREEMLVKFEGIYLSRSWSHIEKACERRGFAPRTRSLHFSNVADMFAHCARLGSSVLVVGQNFKDRIPSGIASFCRAIPIEDDDAVIPLYFLFRRDNDNRVLADLIDMVDKMPQPPLTF